MLFTGRFEYAPIDEAYLLNDSFFIATLVIAGAITLIYFLCWLFSKNFKMGWLIGALVMFVIDTVGLFYLYDEVESVCVDELSDEYNSVIKDLEDALKIIENEIRLSLLD